MFEQIKSIEVDRKNSLPIADFHKRYRLTGTPLVFGDLTRRWAASDKWTVNYLAEQTRDVQVPVYSNRPDVNKRHPFNPALHSSLGLYFDELIQRENDLRVSNLALSSVPELEGDFAYPRLGLDFSSKLTSLGFGGLTAVEPMRQASAILHSVQCHFGAGASVLLVPPSQTLYMYKVGRSRNTVSGIDFTRPHLGRYPALKNLLGYVAELSHGDALYVPAGFWYCTAYHGIGTTLCLNSVTGSLMQYAGTLGNSLMHRLVNPLPPSDARLKRQELRTHRKINTRFPIDNTKAPTLD